MIVKEIKSNKLYRMGITDALNVPGLALFFTMVGFSALAKDAGFDIWLASMTTLVVWGMPGQVAFVSLYASGASLSLIFLTVALANMRMMLMVISGYNMLAFNLHKVKFWKKVLLMHLMAITSWAQITHVKDRYPQQLLLSYYIGFSITIYVCGLGGTFVGYFIDFFVNNEVLRIIMFMTPLYILLLVISSRDKVNRLAVILGAIIVPLVYPIFSEMSIIIGGLVGGSISFGISLIGKKWRY